MFQPKKSPELLLNKSCSGDSAQVFNCSIFLLAVRPVGVQAPQSDRSISIGFQYGIGHAPQPFPERHRPLFLSIWFRSQKDRLSESTPETLADTFFCSYILAIVMTDASASFYLFFFLSVLNYKSNLFKGTEGVIKSDVKESVSHQKIYLRTRSSVKTMFSIRLIKWNITFILKGMHNKTY